MQPRILILGAGKSATSLISYLIKESAAEQWQVTVADHDLALAQSKAGNHPHVQAVALNVEDSAAREALVEDCSVAISLLPPALHFLVAKDCLRFGKHLLTASYIDENIRQMEKAVAEKSLLFLCEMGLDPGIDHMSAMQLIHGVQLNGGQIESFLSHCGGLVAPESDDNPWHYKISWNPRNVVLAGKAGAVFLKDQAVQQMAYADLFDAGRTTHVPGMEPLAWYPNRDSLNYIPVYGLQQAHTFIRTTLRHPHFCLGWKQLLLLGLTDENIFYDTDGMSLANFFAAHFAAPAKAALLRDALAAGTIFQRQLEWLGWHNNNRFINKGRCSAMDVLQFALEQSLVLQPADKDMIVMLHELEYRAENKRYRVSSSVCVKGEDALHTAMAKTVGLPLGIAATLLLKNKITVRGLQIPVISSIYEPVLAALATQAIAFTETSTSL